MLKKTNRINKTRDLQKVYRSGKTLHTPALVIKFVSGAKTRVGMVVSKKVSKKAVERNRIKRALREKMRNGLPSLAPGDYMLVAKPTAASYKGKELSDQLQASLVRAGLWK
ncbi:MAG: rnpA [Candidatus Doudnabacteria bacterium]|nr:rnpA [Candidatus Doudnabacteria bacterium]